MTGIELFTKARILNTDMKVILITGITDPKFRWEVVIADADVFFFKPIEMADLINTDEAQEFGFTLDE